jgi:hypothetical protein
MKKASTAEHWGADVLGDIFTNGKIDVFKNLYQLFIKVTASTVLVYFRYNTGTAFINGATILWGYIILFICGAAGTLIDYDYHLAGVPTTGKSSSTFFFGSIILFLIVGIYRRKEALRNLQRMDGKGEPRYSGDTGLSHLWLPFKKLTEPFGISVNRGQVEKWWEFDEYKFQKYVEPAFIILIGLIFKSMGFSYGTYLIIGAMSANLHVLHLENNYFKIKQETWDAQVLSTIVKYRDDPDTPREEGAIIQHGIIRNDKDFNKWKSQSRKRSPFEIQNSITNINSV